MGDVTVRFVPRGRSNLSFDDFASAPSEALVELIEPSKPQMQKGHSALTGRRISSSETPLNRLVAEMTEKEFYELFGHVELQQKSIDTERSISSQESYLTTDRLDVPEALQESIAFAYIPRPVEYHSVLAVPPHEQIYHLRLSNVAMALNAPRCHQQGLTGAKMRVAMADSGFWLHPFFVRSGFKLIPTQSPGSGPADVDSSGHGTGESANIFSIAPQCTVFGVKQGSSAAGTLETCIDQNPHVMTNSWGWSVDRKTRDQLRRSEPQFFNELIDLEQVIRSAVDKNIVVLFSAGNGHYSFPACFPDVIAVGGVTLNEDGSLEASSYASAFESKLYPGRRVPDVCGLVGRSEPAPMSAHIMLPVPPASKLDGENFPSGRSGTGWGIFSGTSAACPQVAGLVALMKQADSTLSPDQIKKVLAARSMDVVQGTTATGESAKPGPDLATGAGLVDALRACGFVGGIS